VGYAHLHFNSQLAYVDLFVGASILYLFDDNLTECIMLHNAFFNEFLLRFILYKTGIVGSS